MVFAVGISLVTFLVLAIHLLLLGKTLFGSVPPVLYGSCRYSS